jgi:hypothetical protein
LINIETHDSSHTTVDAVRSGIDFLRTHISPMEGDRRLATQFSKNAGMIERRGYTFATLTGAGQNADLAGIAVGMLPTDGGSKSMKIDAEQNRYLGDKGWESDPQLFAQVAVTWSQWFGQAGEHLYAAQVLLPHIQQRDAEIQRLMESQDRSTVKMTPSLTGIYFLHCAFSIENAFKCVIAAQSATEIEPRYAAPTAFRKCCSATIS